MKKILVVIVINICLFTCLVGCNEKHEEQDFGANQTDVKYYNFSDKDGRSPLRVLIDIHNVGGTGMTQALYELSQQLEKYYGLTDVQFEWIPSSGAERETIVDRMKVEIMSGEGPDVCIVQPSGARCIEDEEGNHSPLFPYPEKVMEAGVFLPLDDYIQNHSQLTDWSKQQQIVLAAGRNKEGQQIVPLAYSFPVLCYPQSEVLVEKPNSLLSWTDIITDPQMKSLYGGIIDCGLIEEWGSGSYPYLDFVLGKIVDFEEERLLFSEEELLQRIKEINSLPFIEKPKQFEWFETNIGNPQINKAYPITILPLYSDDGGVAVSIDAFAVVNRNTQRPEDAYAVIDVLMSEYMQQNASLYSGSLYSYTDSIPMNEDLYDELKPLKGKGYLIEENYAELFDIREQITNANFHNDLAMDLHILLMHSRNPEVYGQTIEEMVHETYELMQRKVRE